MDTLEPAVVWKYFAALSAIPRRSGEEAAAGNWVVQIAEDHGLNWLRDATGNIVVQVPATPGRETVAPTVLQGHLDMVCEKNADTVHDFSKDPIRLRVVGPEVKATGTTLGADNGIGVAMALAVLDAKGAAHGPLDLLFTVDEERGLTGAKGLQPGFLRGNRLINIDTEELGQIYIGCAGGIDTILTLPLQRGPATHVAARIRIAVKGLRGGHSGCDIHEGRGNANRILARMLRDLQNKGLLAGVVAVDGGSLRNAIPREAFAVVDIRDPADVQAALADYRDVVANELAGVDEGVQVGFEASHDPRLPLTDEVAHRVIDLLLALPHGYQAFSRALPGLVETSTNLATLTTADDHLTIATSQRSSIQSQLRWLADSVASLGRLAGATVQQSDGYPGWPPNPNSPLLAQAQRVFARKFGAAPAPKAIHAGLECGLIGDRFPGMDMISIGPDVRNAHSPDECVDIASVAETWEILLALLADLT